VKSLIYRIPILTLGAAMMLWLAQPLSGQIVTATTPPPGPANVNLQALNLGLLNLLPEPILDPTIDPPGFFHTVKPEEFDPGKTNLVQATWLNGTGCPAMGSFIANPNASFTGVSGTTAYFDPACPMGDPNDQRNQGLLLAKTGPTANFASATAELINVKGITLTELGYDIRKPGTATVGGGTHASPLGSHCGAGAPRFNVVTTDGFFGVGCSSPPPDQEMPGDGWIRLRWGVGGVVMGFKDFTTLGPITGVVQRIIIVFDEGQDPSGGPDGFGAAILDNIDVNGTLVGHGAVTTG
jgi:hypothetical protein